MNAMKADARKAQVMDDQRECIEQFARRIGTSEMFYVEMRGCGFSQRPWEGMRWAQGHLLLLLLLPPAAAAAATDQKRSWQKSDGTIEKSVTTPPKSVTTPPGL